MALTITVSEVAAAIRIQASPTAVVAEPHLNILTRQLAVAESRIERYVVDGTPDEVKNEAAVRMIGYLYEAPPVSRNQVDAFALSGAKALLADWHELEYATVENTSA